MKLLIVAPFPERLGGAVNRLYRFLEHLDRSRIEAVVVFLGPGDFEREVAELGFRTHIVPQARLRQFVKVIRTVFALRRALRSEGPDLILNWGHKAQILAAPAAVLARLGDRLVWWQTEAPFGHNLDTRLATLLPTRAVACVNHYVAEAQERIRPRRPTFVVHLGIDPPRQVPRDELEALRASLSIPADRKVIGTVGRLEDQKRQDLLIGALADLRERGHDVQGLLVGGESWDGDPRYGASLREMAEELGLGDAVTFTGNVHDAIPYMQLMDVFAVTCPVEAGGNALLEAMGSGVTSVAIGTAGPAEIIEDGRSGLLADRPDGALLGREIERLLNDDELRKRFAESGRERQRRLFSATQMTEDLEERLLELATAVRAK